MALISLQEISVAFGGPLLFDKLSLQVEQGERIALLGRNGVGKTTLMKVMTGSVSVDDGEVIYQKGIQITHLQQEVPQNIKGTVFDVVFAGLGARAKVLSDYHHVTHQMEVESTPQLMRQMDALLNELNNSNGWDLNTEVEDVLTHMKLNGDDDFEKLSGGQKRRVMLARALVVKPQVLLLDEPTNHLDIDTIDWLEGFLKEYPGALFFVTHDRMFMQHLATRIVELDRGRIFSWSCDYPTFLERKKMSLEIEEAQQENFDKKLADEEIWIRKGVKARRTRNEGRVKALERLREEKKAQRYVEGTAKMQVQQSDISGHLVIKASHLGFNYGDECIIKDYSTQIMRGDKIGVLGPNGCGKTTLLRILLGHLAPQKGKVRLGTNLDVAYFDQLREGLDEEKTVIENVCPGGDTLVINGRPRHIIGYLQDFLFTPDRSRTPVKVLSGGERNRLFLARLFTKPSNFLIMDEPTNDLDMETQELLEELLVEYKGTLLLVSHDRSFLNNVVLSTMVFEGGGEIHEYTGGYDDWVTQRKEKKTVKPVVEKTYDSEKMIKPVDRKRSSKEDRELEALPAKIQQLEKEQEEIFAKLSDVSFYQKDPKEVQAVQARSEALSDELLKAYQRWEYLDNLV